MTDPQKIDSKTDNNSVNDRPTPQESSSKTKKKSGIKILEERDKSLQTGNPPNFFDQMICFEYANQEGKLSPTRKLSINSK